MTGREVVSVSAMATSSVRTMSRHQRFRMLLWQFLHAPPDKPFVVAFRTEREAEEFVAFTQGELERDRPLDTAPPRPV